MTLNELRMRVADLADLPKGKSAVAVDTLLTVMTDALSEGKKVTVAGFGNFETVTRAGWTGRDPRNGEEVEIKPAKTVRFRAGRALRSVVDPEE